MKTSSQRSALILVTTFSFLWPVSVEARFLQVDPVGYEDQVNLYAYVGNDPLNATDPSGMAILTWTSPNDVRMTINYTVDESRAQAGFSTQRVAADIANRFTGETAINGERSG